MQGPDTGSEVGHLPIDQSMSQQDTENTHHGGTAKLDASPLPMPVTDEPEKQSAEQAVVDSMQGVSNTVTSDDTLVDAKQRSKRLSAPPAVEKNVVESKQRRLEHGTLQYTQADIVRFLSSLPIPLDGVMPTAIVKSVARIFLKYDLLATDLAYDFLLAFWRGVVNLFFREVQPRSAHHIPEKGPLIFVAAPHHNQFLDPLLLASEVRAGSGRHVSFLIAQKSLDRPFVGTIARLFQSIPVSRAADYAKTGKGFLQRGKDGLHIQGIDTQFTKQLMVRGQLVLEKETDYASAEVVEILNDTEVRIKKEFSGEEIDKAFEGQLHGKSEPGARYKCFPYVDQKDMYASVYECLSDGKCLGIFPEGGSHDQTDLLPLKAGVVIMALGAMANDPNLDVKIVPVGMSYFHPHKFRSRAVVEFGRPLSVPKDKLDLFKQGGAEKRRAVSEMLDFVYDGLKSVTVRAPDYETLMVVQAARRLIKLPGQHLTLGETVEINRRFIIGYMENKDRPEILELRNAVLKYNDHLKQLGLRDHHVDRANRSRLRSSALLIYRLVLVLVWSGCALPGTVLNAPIVLLAKIVSKRKAKQALAASQVKVYGRDVLATWKILVSLGVTPVLYAGYTALATWYVRRHTNFSALHKRMAPYYTMALLPIISFSTVKFAEVGLDVYKSLPPLFFSLLPEQRRVMTQLQEERAKLTTQIYGIIEKLGPTGWGEQDLISQMPSARAPPSNKEEMQWRIRKAPVHGALSHPLNFIDEWVFGWGSPQHNRSQSEGSQEELSEDDLGPDYEEALSVYRGKAEDNEQFKAEALAKRPRRRSSVDYRMHRLTMSPKGEDAAFSSREALPMLEEETSTLQQNLAQIQEIHNALHTFDESFATFLYGIKMNAFCVEWPEAPSEQDLARPRHTMKKPAAASNRMTGIDASADDSYRTDSDSSMSGPGSTRNLRATPKAQAINNGQRRVVNRRDIPQRQQRQPKPSANQSKTQDPPRNHAPTNSRTQTQLSESDRKQASKFGSQSTRRAEPQPVPKKIPLAIKRRREVRECKLTQAFAEDVIDTMPLEYRNGDTNQRRLLKHILLALVSSQEQGVRVAELAKPPELPAGKVNKALIALHAANHVVRTSQNVRTGVSD
ncbi:hypothetical protein MPSI1_002853 [Malassezia psittaci]|uniref:Phospholipid/glycerol acyltransferase domain-containing protein n=1 Tax=Malassezia psittaci TaxID=1821823 RepID=A0AAF0JEM4_9BASI|nr:hypothetical protein MPSI1_002853 [Malassezia psittaci]